MNNDDIIKERVEFLKLEYQKLQSHMEYLEESEWKVRQLSISLWLAAAGVGLGLQGIVPKNLYILVISVFIPFLFLYIDARIGRWHSSHKARRQQIEFFLSSKEYTLPGTDQKISFAEFCSDPQKSYLFPVLDFGGKATCQKDRKYIFDTEATFPHMMVGVRRYFYHSQILGALVLLSIYLYSVYKNAWSFLLIAISPVFYFALARSVKNRRERILSKDKAD